MASRNMGWTGNAGDGDFTNPANWDDFTNGLNPAASPPTSGDFVSFSGSSGGTVDLGGGSAETFSVSGSGIWTFTGAVTLSGKSNLPYNPYAFTISTTLTLSDAALNSSGGSGDIDSTGSSAELTVEDGSTVTTLGAALGNFAGQTGTLILTGAGTTWHDISNPSLDQPGYSSGYLLIGFAASTASLAGGVGYLTVTAGAALTEDLSAQIGVSTGSSGTATVSDGGTWTIGINGLVVGQSGTGSLSIEAGGAVTDNGGSTLVGENDGGSGTLAISGAGALLNGTAGGSIGQNAGSTGTVTVSDGGVWTIGGSDLVVGQSGDGTLDIEAGGTVDSNGAFLTIGGSDGGTGAVTVDGTGSVLDALDGANLGAFAGSTGDATVSDGGLWTVGSGGLNVGNEGNGTLDIEAGGTVTNDGTYTIVAGNASATGTVTVEGVGALLDGTAAVIIGNSGTGVATVGDGGIIDAESLAVGQLDGSSGTLTIEAGGTVIDSGRAVVGNTDGSNGQITIDAGGTLSLTAAAQTNSYYFVIGENGAGTDSNNNPIPAAEGAVTVDGSGALLNAGANGIEIGGNTGGSGSLTVEQGGSVAVSVADSGDLASLSLANHAGVVSTVTVTGTGSELSASGFVLDGRGGTSNLNIENNGTMVVTDAAADGGGIGIGAGRGTGGQTGGSGTATVTTGGLLDVDSTTSGINVGGNGVTGVLNVNSGGIVLGGTGLTVGTATELSGVVYGGSGTLNIGQGGTVRVSAAPQANNYAVIIGNANSNLNGTTAEASGTATVSGEGALLDTNGGGLGVGLLSIGSLTISQGGRVVSASVNGSGSPALSVGRQSVGTVTVTGTGSALTANGDAYVGRAGTGTLLVENDGTVTFGVDPMGDKGLSIGGANAGVSAAQTLFVGGSGTVDVTTSGTLAVAGNLYVGSAGASGLLTISDATTPENNGTVDVADQILIGNNATLGAGETIITSSSTTPNSPAAVYNGTGTINVDAGGLLESQGPHVTGQASIDVGEDAGSTGTLNVAGIGAMVDAGGDRIDIGNDGTGIVTISDGGTILSGADYTDTEAAADIGGAAGSSGTLTVTGAGSKFEASGALDVGDQGAGTLLVEDTGVVSAESFDTGVGTGSAGSNTTIARAGSALNVAGQLTVGDGAAASLTVEAGARVTASAMDIGETAGAVGHVDIEDQNTLVQVAGDVNIGVAGTGYLSVGANAVLSVGGNVTVSAISTVIGYGGIIDPRDYDNAGSTYGSLDVEASGAIVNTGTFIAETGTLELNGAVTGIGNLLIHDAGTLQLDASVAATQTVQFDTTSGVLDIKDPTQFSAVIQDYAAGDEVDVTGIAGLAAPTYSDAGGDTVLTWSNGITLTFAGIYASGAIDVQPDPAPPPAPLPASLTFTVAQALAAFADGSLPADAEITDSAYYVYTNIDALQTLAAAGALAGISLLNAGKSNVAITPTQLAADAGVLALIDTPYQLVQIIDAADVASTVLATGFVGFEFVDTAANLVASLATLEALWKTGALYGVRLTDSGSPVLDLTAAQVSADSDVLAMALTAHSIKLTDGGTPTITLSPWSTYTSIFTNVLARITSPYTLAASDAIRPVTIAAAEDGVDRFAAEDGPLSAAATSSGPTPNPSVLPGGLVVVDYQLNITSYLDSLEAAAADGKIASILLRDSGPQVLSITLQQYADDQAAIALLSPNHSFSEIITAAQVATATRAGLPAGFTSYTIGDTAANIVANLDAIDTLAREGLLARINPTQAGATFYLSAAELGRDAYALTYAEANYNIAFVLTDAGTPTVTISADLLSYSSFRTYVLNAVIGNYSLAVTGEVSFSTAAAIANENNKVLTSLSAPLSIADYASNLVSNLSALETLAADGKLGSITLLDGGDQTLSLSSAQQTAAAAVLADIVSPYTVRTVISSTAASIAGQLDTLETRAEAGQSFGITLTDPGTPVLAISAATLSADALAISHITTNFTITLTDGVTPSVSLREWQVADPAIVSELARITTPYALSITDTVETNVLSDLVPYATEIATPLKVTDYIGAIGINLGTLETLAAAGKIASITLTDSAGASLAITAAQASANATALALITTPHTLSLSITAAQAASATLPAGFASFTVSDTAANVALNLAAIAALAAAGKLAGISITGVNVISLSATQVQANILALGFLNNQTTIVLTDSGTPTITLSPGDLNFSTIYNVLARIQGSFHLAITGAVTSNIVVDLVGVGGAVLSSLTTPLTVLDYSGAVISNLSFLQTIAAAGLLSAINLTDNGVPNLNLPSNVANADATALGKITAPYTTSATSPGLVSGSPATIASELDTLQAEVAAGTVGSITLTDTATPLSISSTTLLRDYLAIAVIQSNYAISLTDSGTPSLLLSEPQATDYQFVHALVRVTTPYTIAIDDVVESNVVDNLNSNSLIGKLTTSLAIVDYSNSVSINIDALEALAQAGRLASITLTDAPGAVISVTAAQATADAGALAKIVSPYQLTLAVSAAAAATTAVPAGFTGLTVADTVANILDNLSSLETLAVAGTLARIALSYNASGDVLDMTAAQFSSSAYALTKLSGSPYTIALTDSGTPTVILSTDVFLNGSVLNGVLQTISTPYSLTVTGVISAYQVSHILGAPSSVLANLTSKFTVLDYSGSIVANIASLETLANDGRLAAIDLAGGGVTTLDLSAAQAMTYAAVLGAIVGPYVLESGSTVTGTAASILADLDVLEDQVLAGTVTSIVFTDTAAPALSLSYAQFSGDRDALLAITSQFTVALTDPTPPVVSLDPGDVANYNVLRLVSRIASPFTVSFTGPLSSNQANDLVASLPTAVLAGPVDIVDYGNTIIGNLNSLETLAAAGKLGTIQLLDGGVDNLYLTAAQATTYAQVLGAITTPYTLSLTTSAVASASAVLTGQFTTVNVTDTAIDIINNLASLEQQALSGRLVGIAITGSTVLDLSAAQVMANLDALGRITGSYSITLTDSTTPTISIAEWQVSNANLNALNHITNAFSLTVTGPIRPVNAVRFVSINGAVLANLAPDSLQIRDSQANFFTSNLSALETLAADGKIASIDLRTSQAVINYTTAELGTDSMLLSKMIDPYLLAEDITVAQIGTTLTAGFNGFAIVDTAADITAGLAQIEQLALTGKLLSVEPTDANPIFTLSAATISADADALDAQNISAYPIILTDSGVPTITLQSYQLGYNMLNSILGAISGPYVLDIVGSVSADIASDFVVEVPGVLAYLATPLTVSDDAGDIKTDLDELEALAKLGMLHSVYVLDGATTPLVLTQQVDTADQDAVALFTGTHSIEVTCYLAGTRIATEHGDIAVEDLLVGERAITAGGGSRPIVWIGRRRVDPARHPDPRSVLPVRVRRDAFGPGVPHRDLFLSPDHAVYVEDVLIPVKYLINGTTVRQMPASGPITYFHVELDRHDVLLAEGLPAESYLDAGNRNTFENGGGPMVLHPDFTIRAWEANGYAPLVVTGPELQAAQHRLAPALTQPSPASAGEGFFPR